MSSGSQSGIADIIIMTDNNNNINNHCDNNNNNNDNNNTALNAISKAFSIKNRMSVLKLLL